MISPKQAPEMISGVIEQIADEATREIDQSLLDATIHGAPFTSVDVDSRLTYVEVARIAFIYAKQGWMVQLWPWVMDNRIGFMHPLGEHRGRVEIVCRRADTRWAEQAMSVEDVVRRRVDAIKANVENQIGVLEARLYDAAWAETV